MEKVFPLFLVPNFLLILKLLKLQLIFFLVLQLFYLFPKCFTKRRICKLSLLSCFILIRWQYFLSIRYSYLPILHEDNTDIFAASLFISYWSFSSSILPLIVIINVYAFSERFFMKRKEVSDARVASITKQEYGSAADFL